MKEYKYKINGNEYAVAINEVCDTAAKVTVNGAEYTVEWEKPVEEKPACGNTLTCASADTV